MGHYHRIVNLTQRAVIDPTKVGVLDKLREFGVMNGSAMGALWLLLAREAWFGDRIAILGYEGRREDLAPDVVAETGLDGTASYNDALECAGQLARDVLLERGICTFTTSISRGVELWHQEMTSLIAPHGVDVVAANLDREEALDPAQFGDSRDLHLSAADGGFGGVTTALALLLAASNRGGSRGGGDFRSRHTLVGSWAGDRIGVVPVPLASGFRDVSECARDVLITADEGRYDVTDQRVDRLPPGWWDETPAARR